MFVLHIALQGCLRANAVEYGVTADTGGHIRYLLDLVKATARHPAFDRIEIVTRAFRRDCSPICYAQPLERIDAKTRIVRLRSENPHYLPKEQLWTQHESLCAALVAHIRTLDRKPDVIHAHYADAAALACDVGRQFGIPFVFTAHSLGRVKRGAFAEGSPECRGLARRIAIEERAMTQAAALIASSRDEAELQYALYTAYDPGRIRIIAPGSDLADFQEAPPSATVDATIDRFLTAPERPAILAIARPVTRKNLSGLVEAYGRSKALQAIANLVIVAGTRDDLRTLEPEIRDNLAELLVLVDRYDLYGKVAYPRSHAPADVPAIYAYARARRGVFVNPALNEPFGLTLLEAAASGLPVVATDSGGPNDIVETCGNGLLVDPRSSDAIAEALLLILSDPARWNRYAAAGSLAIAHYDWDAHVGIYASLLEEIVSANAVVPRTMPAQLLVSDIDGTLIGCSEALTAFRQWHGAEEDMLFAVASGRSFHSAMAVLAHHQAPQPAIVIASVGSEIYHRRHGGIYARDTEWEQVVAVGWDRDAVAAAIATDGELLPQADIEQRLYKLSYMTNGDANAAARIRALLAERKLRCTIIHSHGRYLDVLPFAASKGSAVGHVRRMLNLSPRQVIVAGDSGNDVEMLRSSPHAIIVGNYSDGLAARPELRDCYVAVGRHAHGIIEGVEHFRTAAACG